MIRSLVFAALLFLSSRPISAATPASFDVQADAALDLPKSCDAVWGAVIDLARRPNLESWQPVSGSWPAETSRVRTVMDKVTMEMVRTETVVRNIPGRRLLLRIDAPEQATIAWLDHRLTPVANGCRFEMGVTVATAVADGAPVPDRAIYAAETSKALLDAVRKYGAVAR